MNYCTDVFLINVNTHIVFELNATNTVRLLETFTRTQNADSFTENCPNKCTASSCLSHVCYKLQRSAA